MTKMSIQDIVGNRWTVLYDQAAKDYLEACKNRTKFGRRNRMHWKKRLEWLDRKLKEERGEK